MKNATVLRLLESILETGIAEEVLEIGVVLGLFFSNFVFRASSKTQLFIDYAIWVWSPIFFDFFTFFGEFGHKIMDINFIDPNTIKAFIFWIIFDLCGALKSPNFTPAAR